LTFAIVGIFWHQTTTPTGFVPNEDRGLFRKIIELPQGLLWIEPDSCFQENYTKQNRRLLDGIVAVKLY